MSWIAILVLFTLAGAGVGRSWQGVAIASIVVALIFGQAWRLRTAQLRNWQKTLDEEADQVLHQLRNGERPRYVLYLRPFRVTNRLPVEKSTVEGPEAYQQAVANVDFEYVLSEAFPRHFKLVALGDPGETFGFGRIKSSDSSWQADFQLLASSAEIIVVVPSDRPGTREEIQFLLERELFPRCVFLMPPNLNVLEQAEAKRDWQAASGCLPVELPAHQDAGSVFRLDLQGRVSKAVSLPEKSVELWAQIVKLLDETHTDSAIGTPDEVLSKDDPSKEHEEEQRPMSGSVKFILTLLFALVATYLSDIWEFFVGK